MLQQVIILLLLLLVANYIIVLSPEQFIMFEAPTLKREYANQGITLNSHKGTLHKCTKNPKQIKQCDSVLYKAPFAYTNHNQSRLLSHDKPSTSRILNINGIQCPKYVRFSNIPTHTTCKRYLQAYNISFPVVVKPIDGSQGLGVHMNVQSIDEILRIIHSLHKKGRTKIVVEEQVSGTNYRIFVYNGHVFDVVMRKLASVTGDGKNTIQQLINKRNRFQKNTNRFSTDDIDWNYIHFQLPTVPIANLQRHVLAKDTRVKITNIPNYRNGCNTYHVPLSSIPTQKLSQFVKVNDVLGLKLSGIDYIDDDIRSPDVRKGWVIEVNAGPAFKLHQDALPKDPNLTKRFVQGLFTH